MEDAWVLSVRRCNRRDAIPPINVEFGVLVRYVLTVCLPVLSIIIYNFICHLQRPCGFWI